jgi:hypothetical protein
MSQQFLVVVKKTVVDQKFVAAQPEIPEELAPDGNTVVQEFVPAVPEQPLITHEEVERSYIENDAATIARNLDGNLRPEYDYYAINYNGTNLQATLQPVTIKAGPRATAPTREIIELEAGGQDVGVAIVEI